MIVWHIVFGLRPGWYNPYYEASPAGALYLQGIRVALRERKATQPHDMAYSMLAILSFIVGLADYSINYHHSLSECFQQFLTSIINLHPQAITMLWDAGITNNSLSWTGPSWVPNWANPHPNPAVSSQFTIPARPDSTSSI